LVGSLLDIPRARRVPTAIFDNFCRCLDSSNPRHDAIELEMHTDRVTPLMAGPVPRSFLFSNSVGSVGGVPHRRICILSACLGTPIYFDARRYHVFCDLDRFPAGEMDRAIYEFGLGWVQGVPRIPFEMLRLTSGGRRAHIIGRFVQIEDELVPLLPTFLENFRSVLADENDMGMIIISEEEVRQLFRGDIISRR
jgi:hypothetical protein